MNKKILCLLITILMLFTSAVSVGACTACYIQNYYGTLSSYYDLPKTNDASIMENPWIRQEVVQGNSKLYYTFHDFASDGQPELLVAGLNRYIEEYDILGIWGMEGGYPTAIDLGPGDRWYYEVCKGNILKKNGSSGAANNTIEFYTLAPYSAKLNMFYYVEMDGHSDNIFTEGTNRGVSAAYPITESKYYDAEMRYEKEALTWYPLSEFKNVSLVQTDVRINGKSVSFDVCPEIIDGRTMVPMRAIFEAMGASVTWDDYTKSVYASKSGTDIKLSVGMCEMYKNGALLWLDCAPLIKAGRTMVPVRAIAEAFGCNVSWDDANKVVNITY